MTSLRTAPTPRRSGGSPSKRSPGKGRGPSLPLLAVLVIGALALLAVVLSGGEATDAGVEQTQPINVDGAALPPFAEGQADPAVGQLAPALQGSAFDGMPMELTPGEHPTVVLFATHWCSFCQAEVAELSPWLAEAGAGSVKFLPVSTAVDASAPNYPPSSWFADEAWPGAVMADSDDSAAAQAFGLTGYPFFVFLDADGRVVGRHSGALGVEQLQEITDALQG